MALQDHKAALHINSVNAGWTAARIERVTKLWMDGWSASQIAGDLRVTRNAVIGMVHRRGLYRSTAAKPVLRAPPVKRAQYQNAGLAFKAHTFTPANLAAVNAERRAVAADPGLKLPASVPLPGSKPRPWPTRLSGECCWPVGGGEGPDLLSCCNPVHAKGWCAVHFARGTVTPAVKAKLVGAERHRRAA